jgi:hypothetical protein
VSSETFERLRQAKFDLMARIRQDVDEGRVLELFMADEFVAWLTRRLGGRS